MSNFSKAMEDLSLFEKGRGPDKQKRKKRYAENRAGNILTIVRAQERLQDYLKEHPGETKEKWDISRFHEWNMGREGK